MKAGQEAFCHAVKQTIYDVAREFGYSLPLSDEEHQEVLERLRNDNNFWMGAIANGWEAYHKAFADAEARAAFAYLNQ